jgi:hypothetical protein
MEAKPLSPVSLAADVDAGSGVPEDDPADDTEEGESDGVRSAELGVDMSDVVIVGEEEGSESRAAAGAALHRYSATDMTPAISADHQ